MDKNIKLDDEKNGITTKQTFNERLGINIISTYPTLEESEKQKQSINITEELLGLINDNGLSN